MGMLTGALVFVSSGWRWLVLLQHLGTHYGGGIRFYYRWCREPPAVFWPIACLTTGVRQFCYWKLEVLHQKKAGCPLLHPKCNIQIRTGST